jgi:MFS family permease
MILCDISMIVIVMLQLISLNVYYLIVTRFLQGTIIGVSGIIIPTYLISISPSQISGRVASMNQLFITIGIALGYAMGFRINEDDLGNVYNWRLCVFIPVLMCIVRIIACRLFPFDTLERHISNKNWRMLNEYINQFYEAKTFTLQDLVKSKNVSLISSPKN